MNAAMRQGVEHFNGCRFWHAHEAWETLWLDASGGEKEFLRGLIQLAAAYHHVQRGTLSGAVRLFDSSLGRLSEGTPCDRRLDLAAAVSAAIRHRDAIASGEAIEASDFPKLGYNENSFRPDPGPHAFEGEMQEMDQRDRELLNALQGEVPLGSTPFALIGQSLEMSEKEVIKRIERLKRDGVIRHISGQFDPRALGYRSCLVAARLAPERIDEAAATIGAHPGVTRNYRRNNELNLWFTLYVSPQSGFGLERTIDVLMREAGCEEVRPLPTLRLYKSSGGDAESGPDDGSQNRTPPLTPVEMECVRLLQNDLPTQPRPFDVLARAAGIGSDDLLSAARALHKRGLMRRFGAAIAHKQGGFQASAMGLWVVPPEEVDSTAATIAKHRAVSHCYLRPVYDDWPYNLYATVHARSVDECESIINDLSTDAGQHRRQTLFPTREYKKTRLNLFGSDEEAWESGRAGERAAAV